MSLSTGVLALAIAFGQVGAAKPHDPGPVLLRANITRVSPTSIFELWGSNLVSSKQPHFDTVRIVAGDELLRLGATENLIVYGRFPVRDAAELVAVFSSEEERLEIPCRDDSLFTIVVPTAGTLRRGTWSLAVVHRSDGFSTPVPIRILRTDDDRRSRPTSPRTRKP
jgi:hypothetical protein